MIARHGARCPSDHGFSLIEVIVALALLALMVSMLTAIVVGSRQVLGIVRHSDAVSAVGSVQTYIRSTLSHAMMLDTPATQTTGFEGSRQTISFLTTHSLQGQFEGLYRITIGLGPTRPSPTYDLVVTQTLLRPGGPDNAPLAETTQSTLLPNVTGVLLGYFGRPDAAVDEWQWLADWPFTDRLPELVRIDVSFAPDDQRVWHQLVVAIQQAQ